MKVQDFWVLNQVRLKVQHIWVVLHIFGRLIINAHLNLAIVIRNVRRHKLLSLLPVASGECSHFTLSRGFPPVFRNCNRSIRHEHQSLNLNHESAEHSDLCLGSVRKTSNNLSLDAS